MKLFRRSFGYIGERVLEIGINWALMFGIELDTEYYTDFLAVTIKIGFIYIWYQW